MKYSIKLINAPAHRSEILKIASALKEDLEFKKYQQSRRLSTLTANRTELHNELETLKSDVEKIERYKSGLPAGEDYDDLDRNLVRLKHKVYLVEEKMGRFDVPAILLKELEIKLFEKQRAEIEAFIASVKK